MGKPLKLTLSVSNFERLHASVAGRKKSVVKVSQSDLQKLLVDHSRLLAKLDQLHIPTEESYEHHSQVRQAAEG